MENTMDSPESGSNKFRSFLFLFVVPVLFISLGMAINNAVLFLFGFFLLVIWALWGLKLLLVLEAAYERKRKEMRDSVFRFFQEKYGGMTIKSGRALVWEFLWSSIYNLRKITGTSKGVNFSVEELVVRGKPPHSQ